MAQNTPLPQFKVVPGRVAKPSKGKHAKTTAVTSNPPQNLQKAQFGKHRSSSPSQKQSGRGYVGTHGAQGKHAAPATRKHGSPNVNLGNPAYQGTHAKGAHAKPLAAQNMNKVTGIGQQNAYVGKHSAQGQKLAQQAANRKQRAAKVNKYNKTAGKARHIAHQIHHITKHGKSISHILGEMETKI